MILSKPTWLRGNTEPATVVAIVDTFVKGIRDYSEEQVTNRSSLEFVVEGRIE